MVIKNQIQKNNSGFSLQLANGQRWRIVASDEVKPLIENLKSTMQLKRCEHDGYPKLIFIQRESGEELEPRNWKRNVDILEGLPREGWSVRKLGTLKIWSHRDLPDTICECRQERNHDLDIVRMWLSLYTIYLRAQDLGGLPLHAVLIERNRVGILLAGQGSAGKSTCCRRLPSSWKTLCDDETLIVRDDQKRYFAHPFPTWSDYLWKRSERTWNVQRYLPLSAIFFLEQAGTDETISIGQGQAAMFINQLATDVCQRSWRKLEEEEGRALRKKLFGNACELVKTVPVFKLRFTLNGRFWEKIEAVLK